MHERIFHASVWIGTTGQTLILRIPRMILLLSTNTGIQKNEPTVYSLRNL